MSWLDGFEYVMFKNPISAAVIDSAKTLATSTIFRPTSSSTTTKLPPELENLKINTLVRSGNPYVRLAGISGALAVILGAYGAHTFYPTKGNEERTRIYRTANDYHFLHSLAFLGVPLCRHPKIAGSLLSLGMLLFCGTCYYEAFTGKSELRKLTPVGGTCLIFGWLSFLL